MELTNRVCGLSVIAAIILLGVASVDAQQKAAKPSKAEIQRARNAYNEGQKRFEAGEYQQAKDSFQKAYDTVPNPVVLLSIAESQVHLKELDEAIANLERYLEERPDAPDRADVEKRIEEIKRTPAVLVVVSDPSGADISIDGKQTYKTTPAEIELAPGEHKVELSTNDGRKESEAVFARFGKRHELQIEFSPEEPAEPLAGDSLASGTTDEVLEESSEGSSIAPWIVMGVGAAALAAGTVLGVLALHEEASFNERPNEGSADTGERLALFADVSFGVGAAAVVTGFVLLFTVGDERSQQDSLASSKRNRAESHIDLTPVFSDKSAFVSARLRY